MFKEPGYEMPLLSKDNEPANEAAIKEKVPEFFIHLDEAKGLFYSDSNSYVPITIVRFDQLPPDGKIELMRMGDTVLVNNTSDDKAVEVPASASFGKTWPSRLFDRKLSEVMEEGKIYAWSGYETFDKEQETAEDMQP